MTAVLDGKDLRLMRNLSWKRKSAVRVADEESSRQERRIGVGQGCVLSPEILNLRTKIIMRDVVDLDGTKFGQRNKNNISHTDDTEIVADFEEKRQTLVQALVRTSGERDLKLNTS